MQATAFIMFHASHKTAVKRTKNPKHSRRASHFLPCATRCTAAKCAARKEMYNSPPANAASISPMMISHI